MNKTISKSWISAIILSLGFILAAYVLGQAAVTFKNFNRYVEVRGLDERVVKSDKAVWNIAFSASDPNLQATYRYIADSQQKIINFLKEQGFDEIQSISINEDFYTGNQAGPQENAKPTYRARAGITLSTNDVDKVVAAVQKTSELVDVGVIVTESTASYYYTQLNSIKPEMLAEATANAKEAANTFAVNTQSKLAKIRHASQGVFSITGADNDNDYNNNSVMKKVRVVTIVQFFLQD